jgi:hypothetical protein
MTHAIVTCGAGGAAAACWAEASLEQPDNVRPTARAMAASGASEAKTVERLRTIETP